MPEIDRYAILIPIAAAYIASATAIIRYHWRRYLIHSQREGVYTKRPVAYRLSYRLKPWSIRPKPTRTGIR